MANAGCEVCGDFKKNGELDLPTYNGKRMCRRCLSRAINAKRTVTHTDEEYHIALRKHMRLA